MVAMNVWPTDAADGAVTSEARWRKMGRLWAPSGPAAGVGGGLAPSMSLPTLTIRSGACWADGHYCELTADQTFAVTGASIGLVVVRFDPTANTAELLYLDGATTPTQNPTGIWEVPIAKVTSGVMTDQRDFGAGTRWSMQGTATGTSIAAGATTTMNWSFRNHNGMGPPGTDISPTLPGVYAYSFYVSNPVAIPASAFADIVVMTRESGTPQAAAAIPPGRIGISVGGLIALDSRNQFNLYVTAYNPGASAQFFTGAVTITRVSP